MNDHYASDDPARPMRLTMARIALWPVATVIACGLVGVLLWLLGQVPR